MGYLALLFNEIKKRKGMSICLANEEKPRTGYMVSLYGAERVIDALTFSIDDIRSFISYNGKDLYKKGVYFGAWVNEAKVYLDMSVNVPTLDDAIQLARENKQLAIFDVLNEHSIFIGNDKERNNEI